MVPEREEIENDPENSCFGCGPNNPKGLRLRFFREGALVVCDTTFDEAYSNWPGRVSNRVVAQSLDCTTQWTFYAHVGQIGPFERGFDAHEEDVLVGEPVRLVGRVRGRSPELLTIRAEVHQAGAVRAVMEAQLRVVKSIEEFRRLRPHVKLTPGMERMLPHGNLPSGNTQ
jgi:hypothetical protein